MLNCDLDLHCQPRSEWNAARRVKMFMRGNPAAGHPQQWTRRSNICIFMTKLHAFSAGRLDANLFNDINPQLFGSLHPIGTIAAATSCTPLSVARRLNCAAAFLVSCTSTLMPRELIYRLVCGEMGSIFGPRPRIKRSKFPTNISPAFLPTKMRVPSMTC